VVNLAAVIAIGATNDGRRKSLGYDVITTEEGVGPTASWASLVALVASDDHRGCDIAAPALIYC
jgi:transposase-like protein